MSIKHKDVKLGPDEDRYEIQEFILDGKKQPPEVQVRKRTKYGGQVAAAPAAAAILGAFRDWARPVPRIFLRRCHLLRSWISQYRRFKSCQPDYV